MANVQARLQALSEEFTKLQQGEQFASLLADYYNMHLHPIQTSKKWFSQDKNSRPRSKRTWVCRAWVPLLSLPQQQADRSLGVRQAQGWRDHLQAHWARIAQAGQDRCREHSKWAVRIHRQGNVSPATPGTDIWKQADPVKITAGRTYQGDAGQDGEEEGRDYPGSDQCPGCCGQGITQVTTNTKLTLRIHLVAWSSSRKHQLSHNRQVY